MQSKLMRHSIVDCVQYLTAELVAIVLYWLTLLSIALTGMICVCIDILILFGIVWYCLVNCLVLFPIVWYSLVLFSKLGFG